MFLEWALYIAREGIFGEYRAALFDRQPHVSDLADYTGAYLIKSRPPSVIKWARFCYLEAEIDRLPRAVLQGAVALGQRLYGYETGNLGDLHHCTHIPDVDVFITSDTRLSNLLLRVPRSIRRAAVCHVRPNHADLEKHLDEALR